MKANVNICRIRGIPIGSTWGGLFLCAVFALAASSVIQGPGIAVLVLSLLVGAGLGASIIAHELGHALTGRRFGRQTKAINLWVLGGVAHMHMEYQGPKEEFWISLMGPVVSLAIGVPLLGLGIGFQTTEAAAMGDAFVYLGQINILLGLFNMLVPAFPLDGGRILQSILWRRSGNILDATEKVFKITVAFCIAYVLFCIAGQIFGFWNLEYLLFHGMLIFFVITAGYDELQTLRKRHEELTYAPEGFDWDQVAQHNVPLPPTNWSTQHPGMAPGNVHNDQIAKIAEQFDAKYATKGNYTPPDDSGGFRFVQGDPPAEGQ